MTSPLWNWSHSYRFTARDLVAAHTVADVQRAVAAGRRVRALGTRHSFNDLADNGATLVSVTGIPADPALNEDARTVTIGAGVTYGVLAQWLQDRGWALPNLGSLPHISVAGATATGTHGSGSGNQVLSAALAGLDYVAADGELRHVSRITPGFAGLAVGLGAFGVVVRVTLDIQPTYLIRQDAYPRLPWDRVLADLDPIMDAAYSVSLFTDWSGETITVAWVKRRVDETGDPADTSEFFGTPRSVSVAEARFIDAAPDNLTRLGPAGPWSQRLPHFRLDAPPSHGDEIQSEYFVSRRHGAAALDALRGAAPRIGPTLIISEIRSIARDELWLSGAYGQDTLALHFTWYNRPDEVDVAVREVETALAPFAARAHWGKVNHLSPARLAALYPRLGAARALFDQLDPDGRFSNDRLERLGVRSGRQLGAAMERIWRRSARAILLDDEGRLVLIKRTKPGRRPWWTTAGGGIEESDPSTEAALYRELREELGAEATGARQVLLFTAPAREGGIAISHFFVVRLVRMDLSARGGPEFDDPARGAYDPDRVDLYGPALPAIDLRPPEVKEFILANREALLIEAGLTEAGLPG